METTDSPPQIPSITELRGLCASGHWSGEVHAQVEGIWGAESVVSMGAKSLNDSPQVNGKLGRRGNNL